MPTRPWPAPSTCCSSSTPTTSRTARPPPCGWWGRLIPTPTRPPPPPPPRCTGPGTGGPTRRSSGCSPTSVRSRTSSRSAPRSRRARGGGCRGSATGSTRATTRGPRSSRRPPTRCSRSPARTRCWTSPSSSRRSPSPTSTSPPAGSTPTSTSTRASSTRPWGSRSRCSPCCSPSPGRRAGSPTGRRCSIRIRRSPALGSSTSEKAAATTCPSAPADRGRAPLRPRRKIRGRASKGSGAGRPRWPPHQALLDHGDHQLPGPGEHAAPRQSAGAERARAVHVVEQPLVGPEGPVEPHAVVEAGSHEVGVVPADVVGGQHGVEQRHVRGVGGDARVQERVVRQCAVGPDPQPLGGLLAHTVAERQLPDVALVDRMGPGEPVSEALAVGLEPDGQGREGLRLGDVGHGELVGQPDLVGVERGRHVEDGPSVLDSDHPAGGERPSVADAVHFVEDGDARIARPEEVGVQGVRPSGFDRSPGGHQRLGGHLTAEHALAVLVGVHAPEDVDFDGLEIEQVHQELECFAHVPILPGEGGHPCPGVGRDPVPAAGGRRRSASRYGYRPCLRSPFPTDSSGGQPPPPIRSRVATSTTTGGRWSTTPPPAVPTSAATPATPSTATPKTSLWSPGWGSPRTASRSSGAASSRRTASSRWWRSITTAGWLPPATSTASCRWSPSTISPTPGGWLPPAPGRQCTPRTGSPGSAIGPRPTWAT